MHDVLKKFWNRHPSIYAAFGIWGSSGFMAQPTLASAFYHLVILPALLALAIWMARHEGRRA